MKQETISPKTRWAVISSALVAFCGVLSETAMNVTFPNLMKVFNQSLDNIQWITTGYLLAVAIVMTTSPFIKTKFKERTLFFTALFSFVLGTIIGLVTPNFQVMMVARILQGTATGIAIPLMINIILERIPRQHVGAWLGFGGMIVSLAPAIGPTYGGLIIQYMNWRWIFAFILIVPIIAFIMGVSTIENSSIKKETIQFDFFAFLLLSVTLVSLLMTINSLVEPHINIYWLGTFIASLVLYIIRALTSKAKFLNIRVFKSIPFTLSILAYAVYQFSNLGANFIIPNFLQVSHGLSSFKAGLVLFPGTLIGAIANQKIGELYDRKGPKIGLYLGNIVFVLTLIFGVLYTKNFAFVSMIFFYIFFTVGRNAPFGTTMTNALAQMDPKEQPEGTAIFQTIQQFAGALGTVISGLIVTKSGTIPKVKVAKEEVSKNVEQYIAHLSPAKLHELGPKGIQSLGESLVQSGIKEKIMSAEQHMMQVGTQRVFLMFLILAMINFVLFGIILFQQNKKEEFE